MVLRSTLFYNELLNFNECSVTLQCNQIINFQNNEISSYSRTHVYLVLAISLLNE